MLTQAPSTDSSPPNCAEEAGSALNFRSGKGYKPCATKSKPILTKLPMRSKSTTSMGIKAFLEPLNTRNLSNQHLSETVKMMPPERMFEIKYDNAGAWEIGIRSMYTQKQIISIQNMLSYELNKRRGFGKRNDEECYRRERGSDVGNKLYAEAMYGLDLLMKGPAWNKFFKNCVKHK